MLALSRHSERQPWQLPPVPGNGSRRSAGRQRIAVALDQCVQLDQLQAAGAVQHIDEPTARLLRTGERVLQCI